MFFPLIIPIHHYHKTIEEEIEDQKPKTQPKAKAVLPTQKEIDFAIENGSL